MTDDQKESLTLLDSRSLKTGLRYCFAGTLLVVCGLLIIKTAWVSDDSFISFRSIVNFINGDGITWNAGQRIQAFTHPSWFFLLSGFYAITGEIYYTTIYVSIFLTVSALAILALTSHRSGSLTTLLLAGALLLLSNAFIDYATSGLENPLSYFLLACLMYMALCRPTDVPTNLSIIYLLMAVTFLNRMDYALLLLPLALLLLFNHGRMAMPGIVMAFSLVIAWFGFATIYFGAPLPNPFYGKLASGFPAHEYFERGLNYYQVQWLKDPITLILLGGGMVLAWSGNRYTKALCIGLVLYQLYLLRIGGDFMQGRFFAVPVFIATGLIGQRKIPVHWAAFISLILFVTNLSQSPISKEVRYHNKKFVKGVADERGYYFQQYGLVSERRRWPKIVVRSEEDYSEFIYRCGGAGRRSLMMPKNIYVIDYCGLADPLLARTPPKHRRYWRVGHLERKVPTNYGQSLIEKENLLTDPALMPLFDDIQVITQAPLFSEGRFKAIKRLNTNNYPEIESEKYTDPDLKLPESTSIRRVSLDRLSGKKTPLGHDWNAPGNIRFKNILEATSPEEIVAGNLNIALDHNDVYRLSLFQENVINFQTVLSNPERANTSKGLVHYSLSSKQNNGAPFSFDKIRIEAVRGDKRYSVGHILLSNDD